MNILHVDVDSNLKPFLSGGRSVSLPIKAETVSQIVRKETVSIITCKSQSHLSADALVAFPKLKLIVARTVGTDNVDLTYCKTNNIAVYHIPDYGAQIVAEHALALLLAGARHIVQADAEVHTGKFSYDSFLGKAIAGKTVGVIGTGKIGLSFIRLVSVFGVTVIAYDIVEKQTAADDLGFRYVSLTELLQTSDMVSVHVPLLPETHHLIGKKELGLMKNGSILVNTSRGAIIDTDSFIRCVGKFWAVCLDVVENEEAFTKSNPLLPYKNVILTPHIGFYTDESVKKIAQETQQCIRKYKTGNREGRII